jgi:two-component system, cell cycle sensor histidine kinase and response regulator CckA
MSSLKPHSWLNGAAPRSSRRAPLTRDAAPSTGDESVSQSAGPTTTILIVDDEPMLLHIFERALETDHQVLVAPTGRQALQMLAERDGNVDVIICDLHMPSMSGMDLFDEIGKLYPDLQPRMVFMSGGATTPRAQKFLSGTSNRTITKPVTLNALELTVAEVIAGRR